jgi:hypothetical protein
MNKSDDKPSLVFVYNADSGLFNTLTDIAHKIFSPDTYSCNLCMITHDNLSMRSEWKDFIEKLDIELEFLHRDEFINAYKTQYEMKDVSLPCVFNKEDNGLSVFISADEINACTSVEELKQLIQEKLEK